MATRSRSAAATKKPGRPAKAPARSAAPAKKPAAKKPPATTGPAPHITNRGNPLPRLREICLSFPEATEKEAWATPTFRVGDKLFAMYNNNHHHDGRVAVWCKAPFGMQESLVESDPERYFRPPYVGHQGWVGVRLEDDLVDWHALAGILREGYLMTAPKRLVALVAPDTRR